jgi:hypothetical protein
MERAQGGSVITGLGYNINLPPYRDTRDDPMDDWPEGVEGTPSRNGIVYRVRLK